MSMGIEEVDERAWSLGSLKLAVWMGLGAIDSAWWSGLYVFERCNLDILAACEAKLTERSEIVFGWVKGRKSGVRVIRKKGREVEF